MRFNDAPRAEDVRPLSVLREAFQKARQRWTQKRDWSYVGEMLRSIRQDLTIQMVKDAFVVEVHEYWAQVALEFGDFKQFDQAAVQLEAYYADPALESGAAKLKEVLAWRLLYLTVEGEGLATLEFLQRHQRHLKEGAVVKFAWRLRRAMSQRCYPQAVKLLAPMVSTETDLPVLPESLRAELLRRARLLQLMTVCKALSREKALTRKRLESLGLQSEDGTKSLPIIFRKEDQELVDPQATHDEAKKELEPAEVRDTTMPGQVRIRRRLGRQHEDHLNGFMRAVPGTPRENGPFKAERRPRMVD
ncbi:Leukocyte receptor cluster member 8 [Durusdinium trenchii]